MPNLLGLIVTLVHGDPQAITIESEDFRDELCARGVHSQADLVRTQDTERRAQLQIDEERNRRGEGRA